MRLLLSSLALTLAATSAFGQCPANPLSALSGTWTFNVQDVQRSESLEFAMAGQFTASIGADRAGNPIGLLSILATSEFDRSTTRLERDAGRYQINALCTGGTITMNLSSRPMQYDFWFTDGGRTLYMVSTTAGRAATGSATLGVNACPAGVDPLSLVSGAYSFGLRSDPVFTGDNVWASAGRLIASTGPDRAGNTIGLLDILLTSAQLARGAITRLERDAGRFQVNADCSGGTLTFNVSSRPQQFDFYFRAGFQELDVISTNGRAIYGLLSRAVSACPATGPLSSLTGPWTFNFQSLPQADSFFYAITGRWVASTVLPPTSETTRIGTLWT